MEPLPETVDAIEEFGPFTLAKGDLLARLRDVADQVRVHVPDLVGISVTLRELDVTFTLVSTDVEVAALDAVQYVDGGPCVAAVHENVVVTSVVGDPLDEQRWRLFSAAKAARGVSSTLSLPIVDDGVVGGGFNLYAASATSFDGLHQPLADVLGAWAEGAVTNADLSFGTREIARRAPAVLQERFDLTLASEMLARSTGLAPERWEERLRLAAARADVRLSDLVATILAVLREQ